MNPMCMGHTSFNYSCVHNESGYYRELLHSLIMYYIEQMTTHWSYSTVEYSTVQYSRVQYSTVEYSTVEYSTVQYSTGV